MSRVTRAARRLGLAAAITTAALAPSVASAGNTTPATPPAPAPATLAGMLAPYATSFDTDNNNFNVGVHLLLQFPQIVRAAASPGNYTVFLPTDYAFRRLVKDLTGTVVANEAKLVEAVKGLRGLKFADVVRYHVLVGNRLDYATALRSNGASLTTSQGGIVKVFVPKGTRRVVLVDNAPNRRDARVVNTGLIASNGIVHVIDRVLLPAQV
jgi:uncharacterized surface protein with fasciclin (FAS1) repeats